MTACQTLAQSLSASPSATSYPTTQFSLPPSFHHEISDLSAYNRSFPSKIKCCVDRLSWLGTADNSGFWPATVCPLMTQWTFTEEAIRAATMIVEVRAMAVAVTKFHTEI